MGEEFRPEMDPFLFFVLFPTFRSLPFDSAKVSVFGYGVVDYFLRFCIILIHESSPKCSLNIGINSVSSLCFFL